MSKLSSKTLNKIKQDILNSLYENSPKALFTVNVADEIARDDELVKKLLNELKSKNLVIEINKSNKSKTYSRKRRWKLTTQAYNAYKDLTQ